MHIREVNSSELYIIHDLAERIWPSAYGEIVSAEQISYMLNWMYSTETLTQQLADGHHFFLFEENGIPLGFIGIELFADLRLKIHKLYVLPETQGKGIGKKLINFAREWAVHHGAKAIFLNVNRFNAAVQFYQHIGLTIIKTEDNEIGNGYLMEDYVMELKLT